MAGRGMSQRAYAADRKRRGLPGGTRTAVQKALRDGRIKVNRFGKIDPEQADADWDRFTNPAARRGEAAAAAPVVTLADARTRREIAEAELKELELAERRGAVIPVEKARRIQFAFFRAIRDRVLAVPARVSPELGGLALRARERKLTEELRTALEEIAAGLTPPED